MNNSIILFDGVCNLCNGFVLFIIKHDSKSVFKFAALQSVTGKLLLNKYNLKDNLQSVILIQDEVVYTQSTAAIRILTQLGALWKASYLLYMIPLFIRDAVYKAIAKYRYKFFGRKQVCAVPSPELKNRFLS